MTITPDSGRPAAPDELARATAAPGHLARPAADDPLASPFGGAPRSARRRLMIGGGAVLVLGTAVAAIVLTRQPSEPEMPAGHNHGAAPAASSAMPVTLTNEAARRIGVTYAVARREALRPEIRTVGLVTFDERRLRTVTTKIDGFVERLYVNTTGQPVRAGQPLAAIYSPMLVTAQEELLLADRLRQDMQQASPEARRSADEMAASSRRRLAYWDVPADEIAAIERTGAVRKTLTMRAPYGGYVLEKNVVEGQRIMAGDVLFRVADLSVVWVEGEIFEKDLAAMRVGESVSVEFEALPGDVRTGRVTYIYPTLDQETRTARVRVEIANPGLRLKPGMYATLRTRGAAQATTITIPRSAVLVTGTRSLVFVRAPDGRLTPREVTVGAAAGDRIGIMRGLRAGETVVQSATFLVDAESNLGSALGGMGNMPGMDVAAPTPTPTPAPAPAAGSGGGAARPAVPSPAGPSAAHTGHASATAPSPRER
ncbi:MAG: efflux RND transporter periplasmic adaptor subunit [Gemmatimonadaceae bacterium]